MIYEKYVIFGAGKYGLRALQELGRENVEYFIDNDNEKQNMMLEGIPVISLKEYICRRLQNRIVIATKYAETIQRQIEEYGIQDYQIFFPTQKYYYPPDILVKNPYEHKLEAVDEDAWNKHMQNDVRHLYINQCVDWIADNQIPLFNHVEIETYNRCNGGCEFCPVSVNNEVRPECRMSDVLFRKIIDELNELGYAGRLALFSNNEPFLDERILDFHKYARKKLPKARMHLYTNGTLLSLEKFIEVMQYLDELIIDNYNQNLQLIPNNRKIKEYCEEHPELIKRVTIVLRKPKEILTSRGGDAPNRKKMIVYENDKCLMPFRQMIIRPDGKVSLCCNDPLGKNTMGDLNKESMKEVWYGERFMQVRNLLRKGRQYWPHCKYCDTFIVN